MVIAQNSISNGQYKYVEKNVWPILLNVLGFIIISNMDPQLPTQNTFEMIWLIWLATLVCM